MVNMKMASQSKASKGASNIRVSGERVKGEWGERVKGEGGERVKGDDGERVKGDDGERMGKMGREGEGRWWGCRC